MTHLSRKYSTTYICKGTYYKHELPCCLLCPSPGSSEHIASSRTPNMEIPCHSGKCYHKAVKWKMWWRRNLWKPDSMKRNILKQFLTMCALCPVLLSLHKSTAAWPFMSIWRPWLQGKLPHRISLWESGAPGFVDAPIQKIYGKILLVLYMWCVTNRRCLFDCCLNPWRCSVYH